MPDYIMLMKLTGRGAADLDHTPNLIEAAQELWVELGGTMSSFHVTFGDYDFVAVGEAPNDWVAASFAAAFAASGWATTTTMKGLTLEDWRWVLQAPPDALREGDTARLLPKTPKKGFGNFPVPVSAEERGA